MSKKITALLFATCLFFLAPLQLHASDDLYLGGDSIGIEVDYDGVIVSGTYSFEVDGKRYDPSSIMQAKDRIIAVNNVTIHNMDELYQQMNRFQEKINVIPIQVVRDHKVQEVKLTTVFTKNTFKSGLYVKDKIIGVGTMTYYDPSNGRYGALGHEIMDSDLKEIADIHDGHIYPANVQTIIKSQDNAPGEKQATIDFTKVLGNIDKNTNIGIYGYYSKLPITPVVLPWAKQQEVKLGKAYIYTVIKGETVEKFEIKITKLHKQSESAVKGIEYSVVDPQLLSITNGIVQGMSGSPIVQDGHIIGAVTHVITSNPQKGYGVYIEWMLEKSRN